MSPKRLICDGEHRGWTPDPRATRLTSAPCSVSFFLHSNVIISIYVYIEFTHWHTTWRWTTCDGGFMARRWAACVPRRMTSLARRRLKPRDAVALCGGRRGGAVRRRRCGRAWRGRTRTCTRRVAMGNMPAGSRRGGGQARAVAPWDHAVVCADAAARPPRTLSGTTSGGLARVGDGLFRWFIFYV